jgi:hypothetical protein
MGGKSKNQPLDTLKGWQQIAAFGRAYVRGAAMGVGRNAATSARPLHRDHTRRTQRMAEERIRQARACRNGRHRFNRRIEARFFLRSPRETVETAKEGKVIDVGGRESAEVVRERQLRWRRQ